jgi:hypothetical protein
MKYKLLKAIAHNFSHSFVSYMNYVDDGYVVDDLVKLAREAKGERISVQWIPHARHEHLPSRVQKSIGYYKEWLPQHVEKAGGSLETIREFRTEVFLKRNHQIAVEALLVDDRGKKYVCNVLF